ncbi:glycosyltransferase family 2 protein [Butyricicoccus faecihominis]|uniref:glycosyltransferase family 2 protein n=1 Tax=Butyricicoccaceae TaxID=3085642 RepID=UPI0024784DD1|nr:MULTISPECIES: glycosyltransferase family 2 protein [Butyricicoccaceae]MCQ5129944.1 glycosyltransferase family 2 protein [Butyricicoccus faecihominis]WNX84675.1 glycosyltransferase family 2 protein [Agathobaculum sp. NTUH-O15-33]
MDEKKPLISLVVPCYNEQDALPLFYQETSRVTHDMSEADFEFVFIDDGSKDDTLSILRALAAQDSRVRFVSFSRNFGKEAGMLAGLEAAKGDYVALMDADLQDPPALLPALLKAVREEGYDCAATRRTTRKGEPPIRSFFARRFYKLINKISDADIVDGARDYRMMRRTVVDAILSMREYNRFSKGIFGWVGFKTKWIPFVNVERVAGETKWSFWKLFLYSLEGIIAFSTAPLAIASVAGFLMCLIAFVLIVFIVIRTMLWGDPVGGWPSMICIILFLGGIQLFCMGILGQYLAKTYLETKKRPVYLVRETEEGVK